MRRLECAADQIDFAARETFREHLAFSDNPQSCGRSLDSTYYRELYALGPRGRFRKSAGERWEAG